MSVFGVDFGCLHSCVAIARNGGIDIVINEVSKRETSTIVSLTDQERCIGESGLDRMIRNMSNTVTCLKHWVGMHVGDPSFESEKRFLYCETTADANGRVKFIVGYNNSQISIYPEQVLAMFLQKVRGHVNRESTVDKKFPADVRDCVITVPHWFNSDQRRCVQQACEIVNVNCMSLLNESTAVAVDYGIFRGASLPEKEEEGNVVMIVDIGYGHTSVSVCRFWKGNVKIMGRMHDKSVSTREIDYLLYLHFAKEIEGKYKIDITGNKRARLRVLQAVDKVKQMLSANRTAPLNIENLMDIDINISNFTREEFESIISPIIERYVVLIKSSLADAGITNVESQLHSVEMIGGGCRIPALKQATADACNGKQPSFTVNATESVARGAAITAAVFSPKFQVREFIVNEIPLLPIKAGHQNPNCSNPPSVSFLPGVNDVISILDTKGTYPKLLDVSIKRTDEFHLHFFYDESQPNAAEICHGRFRMGEWVIGPAPTNVENLDGVVKIRVRLLPSGLVSVESAHMTQLIQYDATEEQVVDPAKPEVKQQVSVKKTRKVKVSLNCTPVFILGHKPEEVLEMHKLESEMERRDSSILQTKEARNALESYMFDLRSKINNKEQLSEYVTETDRAQFRALAEEYEGWLYNEGAEGTMEEYLTRLEKLKAIGEPARKRFRIHDDAPFELKQFIERIQGMQQHIKAKRESKPTHISDEEFDGIFNLTEEAINYGKGRIEELLSTVKSEDPTFSFDKLNEKLKEIYNAVRTVVNKPPPNPPQQPNRAEGEAEENGNTTNTVTTNPNDPNSGNENPTANTEGVETKMGSRDEKENSMVTNEAVPNAEEVETKIN